MTDRDQLLMLCRYNRALAAENQGLRRELLGAKRELDELGAANANLRVERDAADELLGAAMDQALKARQP
jgi:hypothetical protein